jgi:DNA-binding MarR family transcriptional regulator
MSREDLGAMFARITRRLIEAERPLLEKRGLTMWGYIALSRLAREDAETQVALAAAIGHDKTRLIGVLDALEADGLITRAPDPNDRRARVVRITAKGRRRHAAAVKAIRTMEDELLADVPERDALLAALAQLSDPDRAAG